MQEALEVTTHVVIALEVQEVIQVEATKVEVTQAEVLEAITVVLAVN